MDFSQGYAQDFSQGYAQDPSEVLTAAVLLFALWPGAIRPMWEQVFVTQLFQEGVVHIATLMNGP